MSNYLVELNNGISPDPSKNLFSDIWSEYERVILHSLVTSFDLDFLVHDQRGGDVDTVHSVRETGSFKNQTYRQKYDDRGKYSTHDYHSDDSYSEVTHQARQLFNETGTPIEDTYAPGHLLYFNKGAGPWRRASLDHVISAHATIFLSEWSCSYIFEQQRYKVLETNETGYGTIFGILLDLFPLLVLY